MVLPFWGSICGQTWNVPLLWNLKYATGCATRRLWKNKIRYIFWPMTIAKNWFSYLMKALVARQEIPPPLMKSQIRHWVRNKKVMEKIIIIRYNIWVWRWISSNFSNPSLASVRGGNGGDYFIVLMQLSTFKFCVLYTTYIHIYLFSSIYSLRLLAR